MTHHLMQAISKVNGMITCIPNNMEKYISFSLKRDTKEGAQEGEKTKSSSFESRFIDSAQFLLASLDKLTSAQPEGFHITATYEPDEHKRQLLL